MTDVVTMRTKYKSLSHLLDEPTRRAWAATEAKALGWGGISLVARATLRRPKSKPERVNGHDFKDKTQGKVIPYGVYDVTENAGWVNVGVDHDTSAFAVASLRAWWLQMGRRSYPGAREPLITADCGGSNSYRAQLWKAELQRLANQIGLEITVCHFPPGTSKSNKIEHRMFCHITQNWRARPLVSQDVVVTLIGSTSTKAGLTIRGRVSGRLPNSDMGGRTRSTSRSGPTTTLRNAWLRRRWESRRSGGRCSGFRRP